MESPTTNRTPCFIEGDDGLASLTHIEAGISGPTQPQIQHQNHFVSRPPYFTRKTSLRNFSSPSSLSSPRSRRFFDPRFEEHQPHFLDSCFLCKKSLVNKDIFMYRGDTPFCSEECRQEEIERDEAKEKNWSLSASRKALRNKNDQNKTTSSQTKKDYAFRTGAVAAA